MNFIIPDGNTTGFTEKTLLLNFVCYAQLVGGKDIAEWLKNPVDGASLGDM
jgi:hypothetical protein